MVAAADRRLLKHYLLESWTLRQLATLLKVHKQTVKRRLDQALRHPPPEREIELQGALVIDATWNHRHWCLLLYRDARGCIPLWRFADGERFELIRADLLALKASGYVPSVVVSDGRAAILKAATEVFSTVPQQRCLLHLVRQSQAWLTNHPKTPTAQTLRDLATVLTHIHDKLSAQAWDDAFEHWTDTFEAVLNERSYHPNPQPGDKKWWYTHRNLRRTWRLLKNAQPYLWTFLDFPGTPNTTNSLEGGINAPLKDLLRRHRGWSTDKQQRAIAWWIHFRNQRC